MQYDRHKLGLLFDKGTRLRMLLAAIGSVVAAALEIVALACMVPLVGLLQGDDPSDQWYGGAISAMGITSDTGMAVVLSAVIFGAFFVKGVYVLAFRWWVAGFVARQQVVTSARLMDYYLRADYSLHLRTPLSTFMRNISDAVGQTYNGVMYSGMTLLSESVTLLVIAITLLAISPLPALAMLVYLGVAGTVFYFLTRGKAYRAGRRSLVAGQANFQAAVGSLAAYKDIKIRDNAAPFVRHFEKTRQESARANRTSVYLSEIPKYVLEVLFIAGVALLTVFVVTTTGNDEALGTLALFALAGFRILPSIARVMGCLNSLKANGAGLVIVMDENLAAHKHRQREAGAYERMPFAENLRLEGVTYRYPDADRDVLHGVDLELPAGSSMAIVGPSGSGKTTLVDVVLGLHRPSSGRVLVDGCDVQQNVRGWQQNLAMVPQSVVITTASVRDNLTMGAEPSPSDDELIELLQRAQLGGWLEGLPEGLDTVIGEGKVGLSGGQRQRLGLARAMASRPQCLVLDEATSALDSETEHLVTQAIYELTQDITLVVVAHRLSTVKHCDTVVYMEDGQISGSGTFAGLRRSHPGFARMVELGSLDTGGSTA